MIELIEPVYWWQDRLAPTLQVAPSRYAPGRWRIAFGDTDAPIHVTADEATEIGQALIALAEIVKQANALGEERP